MPSKPLIGDYKLLISLPPDQSALVTIAAAQNKLSKAGFIRKLIADYARDAVNV